MKKVNSFDILKAMSDNDEKTFKLFPGDTNFIEAKTGKNGWGKVVIAVDNKTIEDLFLLDRQTVCALIFYNMDKYQEFEQKILNKIA